MIWCVLHIIGNHSCSCFHLAVNAFTCYASSSIIFIICQSTAIAAHETAKFASKL